MEELQPLFGRNLQCPLCNEKFTSMKVRSKCIKVESYDTDFCPIYKKNSINGLLYNILVCPHCGYSYSNDFSKYFPPLSKEEIKEKVCAKWVPHHFCGERTIRDAIKTYKLASYVATLKREKHVLIGGLYIRTAWLYRMLGNNEQENRFLKLAIHEYYESFSTEDYKGTQVSEVRLLYLLGELSRRVGYHNQTVRYFSMVIERQKTTVESKIVEMAKERWEEIRNQKEKYTYNSNV